MILKLKSLLPAALALSASIGVHAQFYKLHGASISVGATGNYVQTLTDNPQPVTFTSVTPSGVTATNTVFNQMQNNTSSLGFLTSLQFHPVPWAGVEVNYGYQHYTERFNYNLPGIGPRVGTQVPVTTHEATGAYQFHPKHIPLQPFVNIGGGAIDFVPTQTGANQWRGAGLLETGLDLAMPYTQRRLALRIQGRGLFYRAPNFYNTAISTRSWRVSAEPSASFVYRF
ncbi:MAG: hypothetical protein ACRYGF_12095 [Janthinobacterium lividum]